MIFRAFFIIVTYISFVHSGLLKDVKGFYYAISRTDLTTSSSSSDADDRIKRVPQTKHSNDAFDDVINVSELKEIIKEQDLELESLHIEAEEFEIEMNAKLDSTIKQLTVEKESLRQELQNSFDKEKLQLKSTFNNDIKLMKVDFENELDAIVD